MIIAHKLAKWSATLKKSFIPSSMPLKMELKYGMDSRSARCPDDDTGKNSVIPWMIPRTQNITITYAMLNLLNDSFYQWGVVGKSVGNHFNKLFYRYR